VRPLSASNRLPSATSAKAKAGRVQSAKVRVGEYGASGSGRSRSSAAIDYRGAIFCFAAARLSRVWSLSRAGISQDLVAFSDSLKIGGGSVIPNLVSARDGSLLRNKLDRCVMSAA
jgi:hypothetical protein